MIPAHTEVVPKQELVLNAHFRIEPCSNCFIAGYLIVSPRVQVSSLAELSPDAQNALGVTLAAATRAIESVVRPTVHFLQRRPARFISTYFLEQIGCCLRIRVLTQKILRYPDHAFSTGHAPPFAALPRVIISKRLKRSFGHSSKSSNQSLEPTADRCVVHVLIL